MEHSEWFEEVSNESVRKAAQTVGITHRTLAYQIEKNRITAENVIAIAIAYNHHPVGALVDTGYLEEKWAQQIDPMRALREVSEDDLADEVLRRMNSGGALDMPIDELISLRQEEFDAYIKQQNNVTDLVKRRHNTPETPPHVRVISDDELAAAIKDSQPNARRSPPSNRRTHRTRITLERTPRWTLTN
ncbi:hypothetical protein [Corynebacterium kutscheri]|nr:hypothetical protein [Corynebacterium kutscheri]